MRVCPLCNRTYSDLTVRCSFCDLVLKGAASSGQEEWRTTVIEAFISVVCSIPSENATVKEYYGHILDCISREQVDSLNREACNIRMYVIRMLCAEKKIPVMITEAAFFGVYTTLSSFNGKYTVDQYNALLEQRFKEYDAILKNLDSFDEKKNHPIFEQFCQAAYRNVFGGIPRTEQEIVLSTFFIFHYSNTHEVVTRRLNEWFRSGVIRLDA